MLEPVADEIARNRFIIINLVRLIGTAMVLASMLILADAIEAPYALGYVLLGLGLVEIFAIPQVLARKWRTPPE
jgi:membrane protein YdbS with pleckstrin-like domain